MRGCEKLRVITKSDQCQFAFCLNNLALVRVLNQDPCKSMNTSRLPFASLIVGRINMQALKKTFRCNALICFCAIHISAVLHLSCSIKRRLFRRHCVKNPRNTSVLLRVFPCFGEKSILFIRCNLHATLHQNVTACNSRQRYSYTHRL